MATIAEWRERIPPAMQQAKQWMVCGNDKAPINIGTLVETGFPYRAAKDDRTQWCSFESTLFCLQECINTRIHPMWICDPDDHIVVIDIDRKRDYTPEVIQFQDRLIEALLERTYVELSMSGRGWHAIVNGHVPADINRGKDLGIEVYSNHGAVALTGNIISKTNELYDGEISGFCEFLCRLSNYSADSIIGDYWALNHDVIQRNDAITLAHDETFVNKMLLEFSNREKLEFWWFGRDTGPDGRGGSENDLALLQCILKFTLERDFPDEIALRVFMRSPRAMKLKRKGNQWPQYLMRTLVAAKQRLANDAAKQIDFSVGVDAMMAQYQARQAVPAQVVPFNLPPQNPFQFYSASELKAMPPIKWVLKGIYPAEGIGAIWGAPSSGKSFVALDLMAAVATGSKWFGIRTREVPVCCLELEGAGGLRQRVLGWEKLNGREFPDSIKFYLGNFQLTSMELVAQFCTMLGTFKGLIIIDTLSQASAGVDENNSRDMNSLIQGMMKIKTLTKSFVLSVHHATKSPEHQSMRGHGSFQAACDGIIEVTQHDDGTHMLAVTKSKDGSDKIDRAFNLAVEELGVDDEGDVITSCGVEFIDVENAGVNDMSAPPGVERKPWDEMPQERGERRQKGKAPRVNWEPVFGQAMEQLGVQRVDMPTLVDLMARIVEPYHQKSVPPALKKKTYDAIEYLFKRNLVGKEVVSGVTYVWAVK